MIGAKEGPKFETRGFVATAAVAREVPQDELLELFQRHLRGDWGKVCEEDRELNEEALQTGDRLMSVYSLRSGRKLWIITEADRSVTTALYPDEY